MSPIAPRTVLPWLQIAAVGALAVVLRYAVIESAALGTACVAGTDAFCRIRLALVMGFVSGNVGGYTVGLYGALALIATVLALVWRMRWTATLAAALGLLALVLYCYEAGALAWLSGCVLLLRGQATPDRQRQGQIQHQP